MATKKTIRTTDELHDYLRENMALLKTTTDEASIDKAITSVSIEQPAFIKDIWIYRMVVICLSVVILGVVTGVIIISTQHKTEEDINKHIPVVLVSLISTAVGALAGLLAPSPGQNRT